MSTGADFEDEASRASNSDDSEKSEVFSEDEYSTISMSGDPDSPDDDNEGADPLETVACAQSRVGELPEGADLGVFIDSSHNADAFEGRADFSCPADNPRSIPKCRSIAHHSITDGNAVFLSFDIEIAGDFAGIIQISGEIFRMKLSEVGGVGKDRIEEVMRSTNVFNSYVRPWTDIWDQRCVDVHQITPNDPRITSAPVIETVWQQFNSWFYREVDPSETVILVAWNGESCDLKWLWKLADYSTSIRTNRYYLRIFCWGLDRVVHAVYVVVCFLAKAGVGKCEWGRYDDKHHGRHDFQIDLGIALMNYGISIEWKDTTETRPNFMRQAAFVPCDCDKCFFCLNDITSGIAHQLSKRAKVTTVEYACGTRVRTNKCTNDRVSLGMTSGSYCRMCYRKQVSTELTACVRRKRCRTSAMGCAICQEPICKECWAGGYDKHK